LIKQKAIGALPQLDIGVEDIAQDASPLATHPARKINAQ